MSFVADIATGTQLKPTETVDKSAPVIEKDVKIGENPHKAVFAEVAAGKDLKSVDTVDKSAPIIDKDVVVGKNNRPALLQEIASKSTGE